VHIHTDGLGVLAWSYPTSVNRSEWSSLRNYPDGKHPEEARNLSSSIAQGRSTIEKTVDLTLRQLGRGTDWKECPLDYANDGDGTCLLPTPGGTNFNNKGPSCCLPAKMGVPQVDAGRFAIKTKHFDSVEDAVRLWNPMCSDSLNWPFNNRNMLQNTLADAVEMGLRNRMVHPCEGAGCDGVLNSGNVNDDCGVCQGNGSSCAGARGQSMSNRRKGAKAQTSTGSETTKCPSDKPLCALETPDATIGKCVMPNTCIWAEPYCQETSVAGVRARQLCPLTCGCNDPQSPLVLAMPASGCGVCASGRYSNL